MVKTYYFISPQNHGCENKVFYLLFHTRSIVGTDDNILCKALWIFNCGVFFKVLRNFLEILV